MENNQEAYQDLENYGDLFRKPFESTAPWFDPNKLLKLVPNPLIKEEKYFTPNIEDIRVGYECELLMPDNKWYSVEVGEDPHTLNCENEWFAFRTKDIRVPYLTKEQIEAEGWEQRGGAEYFYRPDYKVIYYGIKMLILHKDRTLFEGECKDINTFRYICKLLNIK